MLRKIAVSAIGLFALIAISAGQPVLAQGDEFVSDLQKGGYILFMRHPGTNPDQADTDPLNLDNTKAQRQLSEEGRRQAKVIGQAFRDLKIPVDKVIASKFQRAYDAAKLLDVADVETSIDVTEGGLVVSPRENQRRAQALRQLLSTPPPAGKNRVIVSHKPNLQDAAGKEFGDLGEGEVVIFKPLANNQFKLITRVSSPDKWSQLVK